MNNTTSVTATTSGPDRCRAGEDPEPRFVRIPASGERVYVIEWESSCGICGCALHPTDAVKFSGDEDLCLHCCGLGGLEFLPAGNLALTKLASKYSSLTAAVYRRPVEAPRRKHKRVGILASCTAIAQARIQAARNEEIRALSLNLPQLERRTEETRDGGDNPACGAVTEELMGHAA